MKLLTKAILRQFEKTGRQEGIKDPLVIAKFFYPCGSATWWLTEYYPEERIFFGYVTGMFEDEWGYSSLDEFLSFRGRFGIGIERDILFEPKPFSKAMEEYRRMIGK